MDHILEACCKYTINVFDVHFCLVHSDKIKLIKMKLMLSDHTC